MTTPQVYFVTTIVCLILLGWDQYNDNEIYLFKDICQ